MTMMEYYLSWGSQAENARKRVKTLSIPSDLCSYKYDSIIFVGMGGSGIVGDLIVSLAYDSSKIPIFSIKDYRLPSWVNGDSLVISISYSGNTIETILATLEALKRGSHIVMVSSGGVLKELSVKHNTLHIEIEKGLVPRAALPAMLYSVLSFLEMIGLPIISESEITKSIENLKLWCKNEETLKLSKEIALFLNNSIPLILTCSRFSPLAYRLKNELNENSKIPVKVEITPEWGHNDIVGWELPIAVEHIKCLVLECNENLCKPILDFARKLIENAGITCRTLELRGESVLDKLMYGSLVGGLASVYLAELRNVNPIETRSIGEYKKLITKLIKIS